MKIDRSIESRRKRYQQFINLRSLPFLNKEQAKLYNWLSKQRILDNKIAFIEDKNKGLNK